VTRLVRLIGGAVIALAAAALGAGLAYAAFVATSSNAGNSFQAAGTSAMVNLSGTTYRWIAFKTGCGTLKVGSYTGNGTTQPITGLGFQPEYVFVMSAGASRSMQRFSGMTSSFGFGSDTGTANVLNSLDADGFTVGSAAEANAAGATYHYVAFNSVAGSVTKATYAGNGSAARNITGVGFQPDYVMVRANDTTAAKSGRHRPASLAGTSSQFWSNLPNDTTGIRALLVNGFQVGNDASVNAVGATYHYIAFKNAAGGCSQPGQQTVTASADSWIDQASPGTNKGADSVLKVTSKSPNLNTRGVVQFNLPALPSGCGVTGATLRLHNKSPVAGRTLEALQNNAAWTETGVTWTNQPATTGGAATATTPGSAGWMQWSVTSQVQAMYSGSNYGFKVRDQTEDGPGIEQQFDSREASTNPPELVIDIG
jgi:hypothetical protein